METNFRFNLSLEEYARLCHRSLSSFKARVSGPLPDIARQIGF